MTDVNQTSVGRTVDELRGWTELVELCEDECQIFRTTHIMRRSVMVVEKELSRLHRVESCAIKLAALLQRLRLCSSDDPAWDDIMDDLWTYEEAIVEEISSLIPGALDANRLEATIKRPIETLVPRRSLTNG